MSRRSDELAMATAVGRVMRSQARESSVQQEHLHMRIARLESRLERALDRVDALERVLEEQGLVLRHVGPGGVQKMIVPEFRS